MKRSLFLLISLIVLTSLILSGCGPKVDAVAKANGIPDGSYIPFPTNGKTVTGGWTQEPDSIAPYYSQMTYAIWITQLVLVGLAEWDDQGNLVAELATEIPSVANGGVSADGLTLTWKLKPGLKWSDGEPLTSADVKFTWESVMDPGNAVLQKFGYDRISSIDTPDDTTAVIHFSELFPPWALLFTQGPNNSGGLMPKHILEGQTGLEGNSFIHWPTVSSGPWVITDWVAGDHMTLLPNPHFYAGRPKLDQIQIKFIPDPETALAALQTGDIDWYPDFSESDIATVSALEPVVHLKVVPNPEFEHYFFNLGVKGTGFGQADLEGFCPFKDVNVRKAITLGLNRQAVVDTLLDGKTNVPATQWPNSEWTNTSLAVPPYDPEAAKALLDAAGYTVGADGIRSGMCDGVETKLSFNFETTTKQIRVDIALVAQSDLAKIGIEFKPIHTPGGTFFGTYSDGGPLTTGKFDMAGYTTGWYPDVMSGVEDSYACKNVASAQNTGGQNNYHICDPALDDLMKAVNATSDPAGRKVAVDILQQYIYDQYYVVMMYQRANVYGIVDRMVFGPFGGLSNTNWNSEVWDVK